MASTAEGNERSLLKGAMPFWPGCKQLKPRQWPLLPIALAIARAALAKAIAIGPNKMGTPSARAAIARAMARAAKS